MAVAALVLGIVALVFCWFAWIAIPCGIIALVLGIIHLVKSKKLEEKKGKGMSITGIILGSIGAVISIIIFIVAMSAAKKLSNWAKDLETSDWTNELSSYDWNTSFDYDSDYDY